MALTVSVLQKPRYVDVSKCTGCRLVRVRMPHHRSQLHSIEIWARIAPSAYRSPQRCRKKQC